MKFFIENSNGKLYIVYLQNHVVIQNCIGSNKRILHRILVTNDFLQEISIKNDNLCSFCHIYPETLVHLFWNCRIVFDFWDQIEKSVNKKSNEIISIVMFSAIFGITFNRKFNKPLICIIILTKYYIHKNRFNNKSLNFNIWKSEIKNALLSEKNDCY